MARSSAADAARTAQRILSEAVSLFNRHGYPAVSADDIARAAGVTRGAIYHHYGSKQGVLRAAVQAGHRRVSAAVVDSAEHLVDPRDQLRAGCHAFIDAITTDEAARLILIDAPSELGWSEWLAFDADTSVRELRDAVRPFVSPEESEAVTRLLSGAMNEAALWLMTQPADEPRVSAVHATLDKLIDALKH